MMSRLYFMLRSISIVKMYLSGCNYCQFTLIHMPQNLIVHMPRFWLIYGTEIQYGTFSNAANNVNNFVKTTVRVIHFCFLVFFVVNVVHCVKSVQIRSFLVRIFPQSDWIRRDTVVSLRIQSEWGKIRTRINSVFGHVSCSICLFFVRSR